MRKLLYLGTKALRRKSQLAKKFAIIALLWVMGFGILDSVRLGAPAALGFASLGLGMGVPAGEEIPPYHSSAPTDKKLPPTLDPAQFQDGITQNAYAMAAKVRRALYQQPCYCHCDKEIGHTSLLDCFTGTHAAVCNICKWEGIYTYNETQKKKTAAQIREGILKGEWKKVDLTLYKEYKPESGGH